VLLDALRAGLLSNSRCLIYESSPVIVTDLRSRGVGQANEVRGDSG
jgi:hypothetical protein